MVQQLMEEAESDLEGSRIDSAGDKVVPGGRMRMRMMVMMIMMMMVLLLLPMLLLLLLLLMMVVVVVTAWGVEGGSGSHQPVGVRTLSNSGTDLWGALTGVAGNPRHRGAGGQAECQPREGLVHRGEHRGRARGTPDGEDDHSSSSS
jgi:hypothetical protein